MYDFNSILFAVISSLSNIGLGINVNYYNLSILLETLSNEASTLAIAILNEISVNTPAASLLLAVFNTVPPS